MKRWSKCENLLIIRADNMGDVLMSSPAIRALQQTFKSRITLLTSSRGYDAGLLIPEIDHVIAYDFPWTKTDAAENPDLFLDLISLIANRRFDGCIIFTVYSQNPLPSAMVAYMAGIPLRLAYCRENPYGLLTHWKPDSEPLEFIRHQVSRDLDLVADIGAMGAQQALHINVSQVVKDAAFEKLRSFGIHRNQNYLILHPGVSEVKRQYPQKAWIKCARTLSSELKMPVLLTGIREEAEMLKELEQCIGSSAISVAGVFSLHEFAAVVADAQAVVSVNTGTVHLAAAVQTPVVVLYAQTNPQHTPWQVPNVVLEYSIPEDAKSKNKVIEFVDRKLYSKHVSLPDEDQILQAVLGLLRVEKRDRSSFSTSS